MADDSDTNPLAGFTFASNWLVGGTMSLQRIQRFLAAHKAKGIPGKEEILVQEVAAACLYIRLNSIKRSTPARTVRREKVSFAYCYGVIEYTIQLLTTIQATKDILSVWQGIHARVQVLQKPYSVATVKPTSEERAAAWRGLVIILDAITQANRKAQPDLPDPQVIAHAVVSYVGARAMQRDPHSAWPFESLSFSEKR